MPAASFQSILDVEPPLRLLPFTCREVARCNTARGLGIALSSLSGSGSGQVKRFLVHLNSKSKLETKAMPLLGTAIPAGRVSYCPLPQQKTNFPLIAAIGVIKNLAENAPAEINCL